LSGNKSLYLRHFAPLWVDLLSVAIYHPIATYSQLQHGLKLWAFMQIESNRNNDDRCLSEK